MIKDEMKCRISMALKDPILQQGFEIICKENAELKSIADFQTSSNMDRYFQLIRSKERLTEAKEIIKKLLKTPRTVYKRDEDGEVCHYVNEEYSAIEKQAEQFLSEATNSVSEATNSVSEFSNKHDDRNKDEGFCAIQPLFTVRKKDDKICSDYAYDQEDGEWQQWFGEQKSIFLEKLKSFVKSTRFQKKIGLSVE